MLLVLISGKDRSGISALRAAVKKQCLELPKREPGKALDDVDGSGTRELSGQIPFSEAQATQTRCTSGMNSRYSIFDCNRLVR